MTLVALSSPTRQSLVISGWGADRSHRGGTHQGLDLPGKVGEPVFAAASGTVVRRKDTDTPFAGKFIAIEHPGGVVSRYLHNRENLVKVGDTVRRGQVIATLGQSGTSGDGVPHVHFDVKLQPEAFQEYRRRFGTPEPGYKAPTALGVGVPAEALMQGVRYTPRVIAGAKQRGVSFGDRSGGIIGIAALGIGAGLLVKALR